MRYIPHSSTPAHLGDSKSLEKPQAEISEDQKTKLIQEQLAKAFSAREAVNRLRPHW